MNKQQTNLFRSKASDDWATPVKLLNDLKKEFGELFDPCPLGATIDGLSIPWKEVTFVNPPYSDVSSWLDYAHAQLNNGNSKIIIFLLFSNTDTKWFHNYVYGKAELRFLKGRLSFTRIDGKTGPAMRPSMLCIFRK